MSTEKAAHWALLVLLLLGAFALRTYYLTHDRFHADEALYAGWALRILDDDPLLLTEPVDKPPLYLYVLAGSMRLFGTSEVAARWPNLAASMLNVALLYRLARRLYGRSTGTWAAFFLACSPYAVLFARTAFTDPLLVTWTLAALNVIAIGRPPLAPPLRVSSTPTGGRTWAPPPLGEVGQRSPSGEWGLFFGLALATKQHALFVLPLILGLAWVVRPARPLRPWSQLRGILLALLGFALPYALVTWWDAQRWATRPSFWQQSAQSYGGLRWAPVEEWGARLVEWLGWARYLVGSPVLYLLLAVGSAALLAYGWWKMHERQAGMLVPQNPDRIGRAFSQSPARVLPAIPPAARSDPVVQRARLDRLWAGYGAAYLIAHTVLGFSVWDRYLLPLAPLASLLLARIVVTGYEWYDCCACRSRVPRDVGHAKEPHVTHVRHGSRPSGQIWRVWSASRDLWRQKHPHVTHVRYKSYAAAAWLLLFCVAALFSGARAARNGYPVGGEHWAYQGLDQIVAYLKTHAPPDAVLYHHWLRWHYTYYLHDTGIELRYWQSSEHLAREVARTPDRVQYIVLPDWGVGLVGNGVVLDLLYEAHREDGSVSLRLFRVQAR